MTAGNSTGGFGACGETVIYPSSPRLPLDRVGCPFPKAGCLAAEPAGPTSRRWSPAVAVSGL
jgi:hypothetical protein